MKAVKVSIAIMMGMALLAGLSVAPASAQQAAQQQQAMQNTQQMNMEQQQHMKDMNDMINRMNLLMNRVHSMAQMVDDQLRADGGAQNQDQLHRMQEFDNALGDVAGHLKDSMQRYSALREDQAMMKDARNSKDMDEMQGQMRNLVEDLNKAVATLEGMNKRVGNQKSK